jgi:fibronectin type 3 domain-containing protein
MLFFHGAGETGCPSNGGIYNNEKQLLIGGKLFKQRVDNNQFDGFLFYPQVTPPDSTCWGSWGANPNVYYNSIIAALDSMIKYVRADADRVVAFGLSAGGSGAWRIAEFFPHRVASVAPSAAAGIQMNYSKFVHIPVWLATGGKDTNPSPAAAQYSVNQVSSIGGYINYTQYPDLGHAVWVQHWLEPGFLPFMNESHKANPLVFFQRDEFCPNTAINAKIGISPGFYAYEWQKDNITIATSTNGVHQVINAASTISFTGNEITVKSYGTYRVRFKRTASSAWSVWSPKPAVIKTKTVTQTSPITIAGNFSKVLPSLDGKTTVPLQLKEGYINYKWYRATDNVLVGSQQTYTAPVGTYKGQYEEPYGCGSTFSPNFVVVNANGSPKPEQAKNVSAVPASQTSVLIKWTDNPSATYSETGYEIYRATKAGGPYEFIAVTAANATQYTDQNLDAGNLYYYVVRAVNNTGAAPPSIEASTKTLIDLVAPSTPTNLQYRGSNQYSVSLQWNPSTDNIGVKRYDIYANGTKMFSTTKTYHTVMGLDSDKWYSFTVVAVDAAGNESAPSSQVTGYTHRQGLNYKYYHGAWSALPNFSTLTPVKSGTTDTVNVGAGIRTQGDNFAFMWDGYIYIPTAATYTFETYSDAGSKLYMKIAYSHGAAATVNNDGVHTAVSKTGSVYLTKGYHKITMTFFETTGVETMQVYWRNDAGLALERIPKNFFSAVNVVSPAAPIAPASLTAVYQAVNKIRLNWLDKSTNETGFEITRSTAANGTYTPVATTSANQTTYTDSGLKASTTG